MHLKPNVGSMCLLNDLRYEDLFSDRFMRSNLSGNPTLQHAECVLTHMGIIGLDIYLTIVICISNRFEIKLTCMIIKGSGEQMLRI